MTRPTRFSGTPWERHMARCLELARLGEGATHPNPMVGCVVLDADGQVVGEGYHAGYGLPHAEPMALAAAGERARGGTLIASLEPCNHTGKTPPCSEAVLAAGIRTVVCGMRDPNPKATGGIERLESAGVQIIADVLQVDCETLNAPWLHRIRTGRPYTLLKQAMTLDGSIATRTGESKWITGPIARRWVHTQRALSDGILSTATTVLADNAALTVRDAPLVGKPPVRIVLDRRLRLTPDIRLFSGAPAAGPIWILHGPGADITIKASLEAAGAVCLESPQNAAGGLDLTAAMTTLGQRGITQLLVEAGGTLAAALLSENLVQRLWLIYGNLLFADPAARPAFNGHPLANLADADLWVPQSVQRLGMDTLMDCIRYS